MPILRIRDKDGNFHPIPALRGKSAYEQAKEGGYQGTEEEFMAMLSNPQRVTKEQVGLGNVDNTSDMDKPVSNAQQNALNSLWEHIYTSEENASRHSAQRDNPHGVTAKQTGAIPEVYYTSSNLNTELQEGGNKLTICGYGASTLNTPYKEGLTTFPLGVVITNAYSDVYGTQICIPTGDDSIFARKQTLNGFSSWVQIAGSKDTILTSPNGDKFRLSVDNDGVLTTELVEVD